MIETITVQRQTLRLAEWERRMAVEHDYSRLVTTPARLVDSDTGTLVAVYLALPSMLETVSLVSELRRVEIGWMHRLGGMSSTSCVFGSRPRDPRKNDFCAEATLAADFPEAHRALVAMAPLIADIYSRQNPTLAQRHSQLALGVRSAWRLEGTPYTSGILNRDAALPYHHDTGNFQGVWSAMIGFRRNVRGGYLVLPEYGAALEIGDRSLTFFDGQSVLHGVSPIRRTSLDSYRFTIVYYSLERMWTCLPPSLEQERELHL